MHPLAVVKHHRIVQAIRRPRSEHEVGQVVDIVRGGDAHRPGKLAAVSVGAILRIEVENIGIDALILITRFQRMPPQNLGIIHLGVDGEGVLELWVRFLPAEGGKATNALTSKSAANLGFVGQAGNAVFGQHILALAA